MRVCIIQRSNLLPLSFINSFRLCYLSRAHVLPSLLPPVCCVKSTVTDDYHYYVYQDLLHFLSLYPCPLFPFAPSHPSSSLPILPHPSPSLPIPSHPFTSLHILPLFPLHSQSRLLLFSYLVVFCNVVLSNHLFLLALKGSCNKTTPCSHSPEN